MPKVKVELKDYYTIAGVILSLLTMAMCYLNREMIRGVMTFVPKIPGKEWSTVATMLFMRMFTAKVVNKDQARIIEHVCGFTVVTLLALAGVFEYLDINPGSFYWGLIGSVLGTWLGTAGEGA